MRMSHQLVVRIATKRHKGVVGMGHVALEIGGRHKRGVTIQREFILGDKGSRGHGGHSLQVIRVLILWFIVFSAVTKLSLVVKSDRDRKFRLNRTFCTLF